MVKKVNWIWALYFLIYFLAILFSASPLLDPTSEIRFYYRVLIAFNPLFLFTFLLNVLAVTLNVISLLPFYGFVFHRNFCSQNFWRYFLVLRLACDVLGHSYEFKFIQSMFYHNVSAGVHLVIVTLIWNIPSYVALYLYAFRRKNNPNT